MKKDSRVKLLIFCIGIGVIIALVFTFLNWETEKTQDQYPPEFQETIIKKEASFLISPRFQNAGRFKNGLAPAKIEGGWGFTTPGGQWKIRPRFSAVLQFSNNRAAVRQNQHWGFINRSGTMVIKPKFKNVKPFSQKRAPVKKNNRWAYINPDGQKITSYQFKHAERFSNNRAVVIKNDSKGYINRSGAMIIEDKYEDAGSFNGTSLAPVEKFGLWGYVDRDGKLTIDYQFQWASPYNGDVTLIREAGNWRFMDSDGNFTKKMGFTSVSNFSGGLARIKQNKNVGYIDTGLRKKISPEYDQGLSFREGLAPVQKDNLWGYINQSGKWIIKPKFRAAGKFNGRLAAVKVDDSWGFIPHPNIRDKLNLDTTPYTLTDNLKNNSTSILNESLINKLPAQSTLNNEQYFNLGTGLQTRQWNLETSIKNFEPGRIYEISANPYREPQLQALVWQRLLYTRSLKAALKNGWFSVNQAKKDGYRSYGTLDDRHLNRKLFSDGENLVPNRPEGLIYKKSPEGQKRLVGVSYILNLKNESKTTMFPKHVRTFSRTHCFPKFFFPNTEEVSTSGGCNEGTLKNVSPEIINVWFVEHTTGPFGTCSDVACLDSFKYKKNPY